MIYLRFGKRITDLLIAFIALIIFAPVFLIVAIAIKMDSKGPVFFSQERLGYKGALFNILKFRTMSHKNRRVHKEVLKGNTEVTNVGSVLRRYKIDELPQLINILKGDMSIVGPRPFLPLHKKMLTGNKIQRINFRPGLTGLAQINGNIHLSWQERLVYDLIYIEKVSFLLDLKIIFKTFLIIIRGEDKFVKKINV